MIDFLAMGGYAFYVWMAYGVTALVLIVEVLAVHARYRHALLDARRTGPEMAVTTRSSLDPAGTA